MKKTMAKTVSEYNAQLTGEDKKIATVIKKEIDKGLPSAEGKIWHGGPVWFIDGNPIVACTKLKESMQLMFFSGQTFKEPGLKKEGSFKVAEARYTDADQINVKDLRRWLKKAKVIQWDYKNIIKRKGKLIRL